MEVIGDVRPLILFLAGAFPVALVLFFAIWANEGVDGKKERESRLKALENELIWNGMWKLVGADTKTLNVAIRLLQDERAKAKMSDEERLKKIALLREYRNALRDPKRKNIQHVDWDWNERDDPFRNSLAFSFWPTNKYYSPTLDGSMSDD